MNWSGLLLGFGGLALGALTLVLSYRERTSAYRHALYDRQVNAVAEVLQAFSDWDEASQKYIIQQPSAPVLTDETRPGMRSSVLTQARAFYAVLGRYAIVLPEHFLEAVSHYQLVFNAISAPPPAVNQYDEKLVRSKDPGMDLEVARRGVIDAGRRVAGTERLSALTMRILRIEPPEQKEARDRARQNLEGGFGARNLPRRGLGHRPPFDNH